VLGPARPVAEASRTPSFTPAMLTGSNQRAVLGRCLTCREGEGFQMTTAQPDAETAHAIAQVLYHYCRGIDRMDADMTLACFASDAVLDYTSLYKGDPGGFVRWLWPIHAAMKGHTHSISNILLGQTGGKTADERGLRDDDSADEPKRQPRRSREHRALPRPLEEQRHWVGHRPSNVSK
jgi:hypothetical protein